MAVKIENIESSVIQATTALLQKPKKENKMFSLFRDELLLKDSKAL